MPAGSECVALSLGQVTLVTGHLGLFTLLFTLETCQGLLLNWISAQACGSDLCRQKHETRDRIESSQRTGWSGDWLAVFSSWARRRLFAVASLFFWTAGCLTSPPKWSHDFSKMSTDLTFGTVVKCFFGGILFFKANSSILWSGMYSSVSSDYFLSFQGPFPRSTARCMT